MASSMARRQRRVRVNHLAQHGDRDLSVDCDREGAEHFTPAGPAAVCPASLPTRLASARVFAAWMIILLGTDPQYGHPPPGEPTRCPRHPGPPRRGVRRPNSPPTPSPTTITSAPIAIAAPFAARIERLSDTFTPPTATFYLPAHRAASRHPGHSKAPAGLRFNARARSMPRRDR